MKPIRFSQVALAISDMLDLVGVDDLFHSKRVAVMALEVGTELGLNPAQLTLLYPAALLHDIGVSSTRVHRSLINALDWAGSGEHCEQGAALLEKLPMFAHLAPAVRYHHTHWDALPAQGLSADTRLLANLIYLTDRADALLAQRLDQPALAYADQVRATLAEYGGTYFSPQLLDTFLSVSRRERFWLGLLPQHLPACLAHWAAASQEQLIDAPGLRQVAAVAAFIVDAKSPYTAQHSSGVAGLSAALAAQLGLGPAAQEMVRVAGLLHDIGKLTVPDEILEKPSRLSPPEWAVIRGHSYETYRILSRLDGFEQVSQWAAYHHETLDGQGYPFRLGAASLSLEARIVAVADIFQALGQSRPYRQPAAPDEVMQVLTDKSAAGQLDSRVVQVARENLSDNWQTACL